MERRKPLPINKKLKQRAIKMRKNQTESIEYDNRRTEYIESQGIYIIRFDNSDVNKDIEYVRHIIDVICDARKKGVPIAPDYR